MPYFTKLSSCDLNKFSSFSPRFRTGVFFSLLLWIQDQGCLFLTVYIYIFGDMLVIRFFSPFGGSKVWACNSVMDVIWSVIWSTKRNLDLMAHGQILYWTQPTLIDFPTKLFFAHLRNYLLLLIKMLIDRSILFKMCRNVHESNRKHLCSLYYWRLCWAVRSHSVFLTPYTQVSCFLMTRGILNPHILHPR